MNNETNNVNENNLNEQNNVAPETNNVPTEPVAPETNNVVPETNNVPSEPVAPETNNITPEVNEPKKNNKLLFLIIGIIGVAAIAVGVFLFLNKPADDKKNNDKPKEEEKPSLEDAVLFEDAKLNGYGCFNSKCTISVGDDELDYVEFTYNKKTNDKEKQDFFLTLDNYLDYIKVNLYYVEQNQEKVIVDFRILDRNTNEEFTNITTEDELRDKLHLFKEGTYTEVLTLTEKGEMSYGSTFDENDNEVEYTAIDFVFTDGNNHKYEMEYKNPSEDMDLVVGNTYKVTFNVVYDFNEYVFDITSIEQ